MKTINVTVDKNENEYFQVIFPYQIDIINAIRKIPTRKFDPKTKSWLIKAEPSLVEYIEVFSKYFNFEITQEVHDLLEQLKLPIESHPIIVNDDFSDLKRQLYPFQKLGIIQAMKFEKCLLADDMGLGKSGEAIVAVEKLNAYPCLVVCPASLKLNWQREIDLWINRNNILISGGKELDSYSSDFVVINYDILNKHLEFLKNAKFKSIILDESHYVKNRKSGRTKAVKKLVKNIKYRFALTGTPILNRPSELITQLDALGKLDILGGFWTFAVRYCGAVQTAFGWDFSGATNTEELNTKLKDVCMVRRLKSEVLSELPNKQRTLIPIEVDNRKEYDLAVKDFKKWIKNTLINVKDYTKEVNKLKNLTTSQKRILIDAKIAARINRTLSAEALAKIEYLKQITARGKFEKIKEFIDNALEQGIKLVVFSVHREIQNLLWKNYKDSNPARIFSEDDLELRQEYIDKFQNDDSCKLMIASLKAGGVGITLTASNTVIFCEFGWTPADHDQAEDRTHRLGQKNSVNCYYLYGKDTIDESILELVDKKRSISEAIIDGKTATKKVNDIEEIINKFISE